MNTSELVILSIGLAMDAVAVSFICSVCESKSKKRLAIKAALFFGVFQALMPVLGYLAGILVKNSLASFDHWIAFVLLLFVGGKMVVDNQKEKEGCSLYSNKQLLVLSIATSIDALIIGVTFSFMDVNLLTSVLTIGVVTFILSAFAGLIGKKLPTFNPKYLNIIGGLAIISIGVKILITHILN